MRVKNLKSNYPDLIEENDNKLNSKINFFNMPKLTRNIFSVAEGASGLLFMMHYYKTEINKFNAPNFHFSIIIFVDNDDGAKGNKKN